MIKIRFICGQELIFDKESYEIYLNKFVEKGYKIIIHNGYLARTFEEKYKQSLFYGKIYYFHRFIMQAELKSKGKYSKDFHVHHKNENKLDNRKENLQLIDATEHFNLHYKQKNVRAFHTWYNKVYGEPQEDMWETYPEFQEWLENKQLEEHYG